MLSSLTDRVAGHVSWGHTLGTVLTLVVLEEVLSADNAVALAGLVRDVQPEDVRQKVLNRGLLLAFLLRGLMLMLAGFVIQNNFVRLLAGAYLVWLAWRHFQEQLQEHLEEAASAPVLSGAQPWRMVAMLGFTDLAFSLDSVGAAVAVTDQFALVLIGGGLGVVLLRFLAGWVLAWMEQFVHLQNAAYITVLFVGLRLLMQVWTPALVPSEPVLMVLVLTMLAWGFSQRSPVNP
jgi:YkoY family integral membrane protein